FLAECCEQRLALRRGAPAEHVARSRAFVARALGTRGPVAVARQLSVGVTDEKLHRLAHDIAEIKLPDGLRSRAQACAAGGRDRGHVVARTQERLIREEEALPLDSGLVERECERCSDVLDQYERQRV